MSAPLIDTHVNLHAHAFDADRTEVIARARAAGIGPMITICDTWANRDAVNAIAAADPSIYCSIGAHPHYAKDHLDLTADKLADWAQSHPKCVAIGETGLDLYYNHSPIEDQRRVLAAHIEAARRTGKTLIIHTRDADALMAQTLEEETARGRFKLLLHCYTSGVELARRALALGAYISFSGILTFKNAHDVRAIASEVPLDRVMLETDCPYLTPAPHRGRRCEPMHMVEIYDYFCGLRGLEPEPARVLIARNVEALFGVRA